MIKNLNEAEVESVTGGDGSYIPPVIGIWDYIPWPFPQPQPGPPLPMNG